MAFGSDYRNDALEAEDQDVFDRCNGRGKYASNPSQAELDALKERVKQLEADAKCTRTPGILRRVLGR